MRILLVSPFFPPLHAVASLRTYGFARAWARAGCEVTVLTTAKRPDQAGMPRPLESIKVVEVEYAAPVLLEKLRRRHKSALPAPPGPLDQSSGNGLPAPPRRWFRLLRWFRERTGVFSSVRMPDLTDFWVGPALAWARRQPAERPWDVVVSSAGPYTAHLVARALKRDRRARYWVADFRDLWTQNHLYHGLFPFTLIETREESRCLREADLLVTVTEELAGKLRSRTVRPVEVIYNGYDPESLTLLPAAPYFPPDGQRRLVYSGTFYPQGQDPTPLLCALKRLRALQPNLGKSLSLVVAGWSGPLWRELARRHGVADLLHILGVLPHEETLRLERDATALVLLDWHDPRQGVMTGKVFEYLSAPGPILTIGGATDSTLAQMIRRTGRGFHLGADEDRITNVLVDLLDNPAQLHLTPDNRVLGQLTRPVQSLRLLERMRQALAVAREDRHLKEAA
jgi:glycosyltransferase involved in cell wall biosynthesis